MRSYLPAAAGLACLVASASAFAHHPGGAGNAGGAGPIVTISAATLGAGQSSVAVLFEISKFNTFNDGQLASFAGKGIHAHGIDTILAPSVAMAYGITNDLMISARLPYVKRKDIREGVHDDDSGLDQSVARGDASGLGDLTTLLQWRFVNNTATGTQWALLGGVRAPIGETGRVDRMGERFETEFQPGSGSWDWMVGLAASQRMGRWSFDANVLYTLAGRGAQQTDLGDRFLYNAAVSYRLRGGGAGRGVQDGQAGHMHLGAGTEPMYHGAGGAVQHELAHQHEHAASPSPLALDAVLELNGEWHDRQRVAGGVDPSSGGNVVYLSPGVRLSGDKWSTFVSFGVPVITNLYGTQAEPDYRVISGVTVRY